MKYYDKLVFELSKEGRKGYSLPVNKFPHSSELPAGLQRMEGRKLWQGCHLLVNLRIVLHGAGAQRIEAGIHAEVHLGEVGIVTDHIRLAHLGQVQGRFTAQPGGNLRG